MAGYHVAIVIAQANASQRDFFYHSNMATDLDYVIDAQLPFKQNDESGKIVFHPALRGKTCCNSGHSRSSQQRRYGYAHDREQCHPGN